MGCQWRVGKSITHLTCARIATLTSSSEGITLNCELNIKDEDIKKELHQFSISIYHQVVPQEVNEHFQIV